MGAIRKRVIIADDEAHIRRVFRDVIERENLEVVAEAADGEEAVEFYRRDKPDVLFMDINMPHKTGEEGLKEILAEFPEARVVMLTMVADTDTVRRCVEAGAAGYILKSLSVNELRDCVREVMGVAGSS